jgi:hypothetical protein
MESKNSKLLQALRNAGCDRIAEAYQWVQDNKKQVWKEVYGPVLLVVCSLFFSLHMRHLLLYIVSTFLR